MNSQNIYEKELLKESKEEFDKYILFLKNDKEAKKSFNHFLFDDIYTKIGDNNNNIELNNISNSSLESKLKNYLENILSKVLNNNYLKDVKENLILTQKNIQTKILECDDHIKILKNEYKNIKIQKLLPINKTTKLIFEKKTVLHINKANKHNNILGEFFARYIFNSVRDNSSNNTFNNFYDEKMINNYIIDNNTKINNFEDTDQNFKYWIILLNLIKKLFDTKSDYEIIFNYNKLKDHITNVLKKEEPKKKDGKGKDKKKDGKGKGKKYRGGGDNAYIMAEYLESIDKKTQKGKYTPKNTSKNTYKNKPKENLKNYYLEIFRTVEYDKNKLINIYADPFKKKMELYFKNIKEINKSEQSGKYKEEKDIEEEIKEIEGEEEEEEEEYEEDEDEEEYEEVGEEERKNIKGGVYTQKQQSQFQFQSQSKHISVDHPFRKNYKINDQKYINEFNIFEYLYELQQNDNEEDITEFIVKIKDKTILILYYLYVLKKNIYIKFINLLSTVFNINMPKLIIQKSPQQNNKQTTSKSINQNNKNIEKIELLQKQNFITYSDEVIKEYENMQKKLVQKYYEEHNIPS